MDFSTIRARLRGTLAGVLAAAIAICPEAALARKLRASAPATPQRVVIPIERTVIPPSGLVRYWVPVTIGGIGPIRALLDTGATGLLVLDNALNGKVFPKVGTFDYSFDSGEKLSGTIAQARLSIGGLTSGGALHFGVVRKAKCLKDKPKCLAAQVKPADYTIGGDGTPGKGFKALIGIALDRILIANPLFGAGASSWIVVLPLPGSPEPGALIVNPNAADLAGFRRYPIGKPSLRLRGAMRSALPGCLTAPAFELCGLIGLDTGAPSIYAKVASVPPIATEPAPQHYTLAMAEGESKLEVAVEESKYTGRLVYFERIAKQQTPAINAGFFPYYSYQVLYDFSKNEIGFKRR
jgi:hypothetical protein